MRMPALSSKPAPLALGSRDADGGNRVELLPRKNPLVDQLLNDFVRRDGAFPPTGRLASPAAEFARPAFPRAETRPAPATAQANALQPSEVDQLKIRINLMEARLKTLEAANCERKTETELTNERILAVLEQLVAEMRERN